MSGTKRKRMRVKENIGYQNFFTDKKKNNHASSFLAKA